MDHKVGVIPFDIKGDRIAILFVTSQGRGRWILPKGDLKPGESHKKGCKREAFEEAGVKGVLLEDFPMTNLITKSGGEGMIDVAVTYYPMFVEKQHDKWPESGKRQRHWAILEDAPKVTDRQDFLSVISQFAALKPLILERSRQKIEKRQAKRKRVQ
jgi:ADP-ribose pyrophosphatase YjhB (NUDIX family)